MRPEKCFFFLALSFGILFLFVTPPFQVADEYYHFFRAYHVAEGNILSQHYKNRVGDFLPRSISKTMREVSSGIAFNAEGKQDLKDILKLIHLPLNPNERQFVDFPTVAKYHFVPYLPQSFGIVLGKNLHLSPILLLYLGRIFNLLAWTLLVFFSIKAIPIGKWLFSLLALTPMSIFQAASLSADALTNGLSFLLIAYIFRCAYLKSRVERIDILIILLLSLLLTLSKLIYGCIFLLFFLIPLQKVGSLKKYLSIFFMILIINLLVSWMWIFLTQAAYIRYEDYNSKFRLGQALMPGVVPHEQALYILSHPFEYLQTFGKTLLLSGGGYLKQFIGVLGWADTKLPLWLIFLNIPLIIFVALFDFTSNVEDSDLWKNKTLTTELMLARDRPLKSISILLKDRFILLGIFLLALWVVLTSQFIMWTPVGAKIIRGVQGRYFIPIVPVFLLMLYYKQVYLRQKINYIHAGLAVLCCFSLATALFITVKRYYF